WRRAVFSAGPRRRRIRAKRNPAFSRWTGLARSGAVVAHTAVDHARELGTIGRTVTRRVTSAAGPSQGASRSPSGAAQRRQPQAWGSNLNDRASHAAGFADQSMEKRKSKRLHFPA